MADTIESLRAERDAERASGAMAALETIKAQGELREARADLAQERGRTWEAWREGARLAASVRNLTEGLRDAARGTYQATGERDEARVALAEARAALTEERRMHDAKRLQCSRQSEEALELVGRLAIERDAARAALAEERVRAESAEKRSGALLVWAMAGCPPTILGAETAHVTRASSATVTPTSRAPEPPLSDEEVAALAETAHDAPERMPALMVLPRGVVRGALSRLSAAEQRTDEARAALADVVEVANRHGWNGVENSKVLSVFLDRALADGCEARAALGRLEAAARAYQEDHRYDCDCASVGRCARCAALGVWLALASPPVAPVAPARLRGQASASAEKASGRIEALLAGAGCFVSEPVWLRIQRVLVDVFNETFGEVVSALGSADVELGALRLLADDVRELNAADDAHLVAFKAGDERGMARARDRDRAALKKLAAFSLPRVPQCGRVHAVLLVACHRAHGHAGAHAHAESVGKLGFTWGWDDAETSTPVPAQEPAGEGPTDDRPDALDALLKGGR